MKSEVTVEIRLLEGRNTTIQRIRLYLNEKSCRMKYSRKEREWKWKDMMSGPLDCNLTVFGKGEIVLSIFTGDRRVLRKELKLEKGYVNYELRGISFL